MGVITTISPAIVTAGDEMPWLFANAGESFFDDKNNYFTAYLDLPDPVKGIIIRRQVCRLILPLDAAKEIRAQAARDWAKGGH